MATHNNLNLFPKTKTSPSHRNPTYIKCCRSTIHVCVRIEEAGIGDLSYPTTLIFLYKQSSRSALWGNTRNMHTNTDKYMKAYITHTRMHRHIHVHNCTQTYGHRESIARYAA